MKSTEVKVTFQPSGRTIYVLPGTILLEAAGRAGIILQTPCGGMLAFDVGEIQDHAKTFISALKIIYHAVSLGATESLICIPYLTTMLYMPPERRTSFGVKVNTVRLSVGIEPVEQLLEDIEQALTVI